MKFGYQNGKIKKMDDIKILPYDLGFLRGYKEIQKIFNEFEEKY